MERAISRKIYVWQLPVRFYHWLNALCVTALAVTGYLIGSPPAIQSGSEASFGYWFGTIRFIHFVAAFIFFFNFLFRIYWGFVGNRFAKWNNFIPTKTEQWKEMLHVLCLDVLQICKKPLKSIGHNSLAGITYFITFLAFLFQAITGFGMYSAMSDAWLPNLFSWIVPLMGGDFAVRQWHHVMMWFFVIFAIIHVYLVFYHDYIEERGTISSMAGGWKFIEKE
jgi:Ni/Fe-hydrogenase 1 B-type cytochrome subunit